MTAMTPSPPDEATGAAASSPTTSTSTFTDADAIRLGGWNAAHARVLVAASDGVVAAALVDTNGDGRHVDLSVYRRVGDAWVWALEHTDVGKKMAKSGEVTLEADPHDDGEAYIIDWGPMRPFDDAAEDDNGRDAMASPHGEGLWMGLRPACEDD